MEKSLFQHKVLMITGGTGSFGKAVLQKLLSGEFDEIRVFSRDEKKQEDLRNEINNPKLSFFIGDVRDKNSVRQALRGVDYVFHAAALKQVPSCEFHPLEAVQTNILGTENILTEADIAGVERVIVLSTDKAVYPINAMGITKAMAEKVLVAKSRFQANNGTVFSATRYGNVMASRGSVIPLFISQILSNTPITITDPNMSRFMMSLEESVNLVLFALKNGQQGDIYVQKAPACRMGDLAQSIKEIFGVPDHETQIIGTRHGEKLHETLASREELAHSQDLGDYYRIEADTRNLNYAKYFSQGSEGASNAFDFTSANSRQLNVEELKDVLLRLDFVREKLNA